MKEATVTLRSKNPYFFNTARKHEFLFVPPKDYKGQAVDIEEGWFYCDVPTKIMYKDDFGIEKVLFENYAQHLINCYDVETVVVKEKEVMEAPIVRPKKKKEKQNEKVIS